MGGEVRPAARMAELRIRTTRARTMDPMMATMLKETRTVQGMPVNPGLMEARPKTRIVA